MSTLPGIPVKISRKGASSATFEFSLPPGLYSAVALWGRCVGRADIRLLPRHTRVMALAAPWTVYLQTSFLHNSLAGSLPFDGLRVRLRICMYSSFCNPQTGEGYLWQDAQLDDRAYYLNEVPPGQWTLFVRDSDGALIMIPIDSIPRYSVYEVVTRNISEQELEQALIRALPTPYPLRQGESSANFAFRRRWDPAGL